MNGAMGHVTVTTQNAVDIRYPLADIDMRACMGLQAIMQTIMMGKMEIVLPDMYMMKRFIGICFRGPRATSQQRCKIKTSNSDSNDSSEIEMESKGELTLGCLPSPPGSYQSPGCWCQAQASPNNRWDKRHLPDRPGVRLDSCNTDATQKRNLTFHFL